MITLTGHYAESPIIESIHTTMYLEQQSILFKMLNPRIEIDGNQWCVIWGEMPEKYIVGFGDTLALAMQDFSTSYYSQKAK